MEALRRLYALPLEITACELVPQKLTTASGFERKTSVVRLRGAASSRGAGAGDLWGEGEDVTYDARDQEHFQSQAAAPIEGSFSLGEFSQRLAALELFEAPPSHPSARHYRRWAFESAALDLALRQNELSLSRALEREPRPLRFVVSMGLGQPPSLDALQHWLERDPQLRFKLDANPDWDEDLVARLAQLDCVDVVDFKGAYRGTPVDQGPDLALYRRVAEGLPGVWLEDPALTPETLPLLTELRSRVAWDAPIESAAALAELPFKPGAVNIKPSRSATLAELFELYEQCARAGIQNYGGGQFELACGRRQIQLLAALFHSDAPNDVAPVDYNSSQPPADLPPSPLELPPGLPGFG